MPIDPGTAMLISGLASGVLGGIQGANAGNMSREQLSQQNQQFGSQLRQTQGQQALLASQMDPLMQQRSRQKAALVEQLMKNMSSPTLNVQAGKFEGGAQITPDMLKNIASFFTPEARQNAEAQFGLNATAASGGQYALPSAYPNTGNFTGVGYGTPTAPTTPMPSVPGVPGTAGPGTGAPSFGSPSEEERRRRMTGRSM